MTSKDLFLRGKDEVTDALKITKSITFERMIAFARAEFMEHNPTFEQSTGAANFIRILCDLPEDVQEPTEWISSGLQHDLSIPSRTEVKPPETKS